MNRTPIKFLLKLFLLYFLGVLAYEIFIEVRPDIVLKFNSFLSESAVGVIRLIAPNWDVSSVVTENSGRVIINGVNSVGVNEPCNGVSDTKLFLYRLQKVFA